MPNAPEVSAERSQCGSFSDCNVTINTVVVLRCPYTSGEAAFALLAHMVLLPTSQNKLTSQAELSQRAQPHAASKRLMTSAL